MNLNADTIVNVLIALAAFKVIDKLFLNDLLEKIPGMDSYEA